MREREGERERERRKWKAGRDETTGRGSESTHRSALCCHCLRRRGHLINCHSPLLIIVLYGGEAGSEWMSRRMKGGREGWRERERE